MRHILSFISKKKHDLETSIRIWLSKKVFKHKSIPIVIKTIGGLIVPIFATYLGINADKIIGESLFVKEALISLLLFLSIPTLLFIADALERKAPTLKKLGELSTELREIVNFYPCFDKSLTIDQWKNDFHQFSAILENLICLVISDLERNKVPAISRKYHIACNLMIYTKPEVIDEDGINKLLSELSTEPSENYNLYNGIDEEKEVVAFLIMAGISKKCIERNYEPGYIKVFSEPRATYPGAPILAHEALEEENNHIEYISDISDFKDFGALVSKPARQRFREIFKERKEHVRSFASVPLYWDGILIGCINIESYVTNFLDFKVDKAIRYAINVIRPVAETFAYEFFNKFISESEDEAFES